jgi:hypothetical protein
MAGGLFAFDTYDTEKTDPNFIGSIENKIPAC